MPFISISPLIVFPIIYRQKGWGPSLAPP